jgi:hypothetical protein
MRATAREVGSELEATRTELQRGVMELPEETRSSAAAMRRVVAEQIEALAELNAIVRAQPATHDLNEAAPPPAPARTARPEPTPEPRAAEPPPRQPDAPRFSEARSNGREAVAEAEAPARRAPEPKPQPQVAQEAPVRAAGKPEEGGGGWLRDVLRNATVTTAGVQSGLNGLTDDIANALDANALADAWSRYQAGEQNVFSRRIYTLAGQATYDDVRKRLEADADFRRSATTYMAEFEQLLKRAAGGSDPMGETREYLLSERGKVYTMLAHAGGRLK